jgi:hypothetical protein
MAAKKKVTRTPRAKGPELAVAVKARKKLQKLLGRQKAGTITGKELETGLKEVSTDLKNMSIWIHIICN